MRVIMLVDLKVVHIYKQVFRFNRVRYNEVPLISPSLPLYIFIVHGNLQSPDGLGVEEKHAKTSQTTILQNQPQGQVT